MWKCVYNIPCASVTCGSVVWERLTHSQYLQFHGSISRGCVAFSKAHCTAALVTVTVVHYCSLQSSVVHSVTNTKAHCSLVHCCVLPVTRKLISFKRSFFALYIAYHSTLPIFFCIYVFVFVHLCICVLVYVHLYLCICVFYIKHIVLYKLCTICT